MTVRCRFCGSEETLTERESSDIAIDLDSHYSFEQQSHLTFSSVCSACWEKEGTQLQEDAELAGRRVVVIGVRAA